MRRRTRVMADVGHKKFMSWDIFVQDIPLSAKTPDDIPDDFEPASLGLRADIIRKIREVVPFADFSDPAWGVIDGPDFSVEVSLGEESEVESFAFHVRGGDAAAVVVSEILAHLNMRAFDPASDSGMFEPDALAKESIQCWRAYRNSVVR